MSDTRMTRSGAARQQRVPSASPGSKKGAASSRKNNHTSTSVQEMLLDAGEDTTTGEGQQGNSSSTASSQQALVGMAQMLAQQQQQLALLSQLAQQHHGALSQGAGSAPPPARSITGPMPKGAFDRRYKGEGGAALDEWIAFATQMLAYYSGLTGTQAAVWLATGLESAALAWYQNQFKHQPPSSGSALFDALRTRFQPINSEETTRYELAALKQGPKQSVDEYATRFLHLISLLPDESVASRIFQFRLGLHRAVDDKIRQAATQPTTLQDAIATAARIEGRGGAAASSSGDHCSNMEVDPSSAILARLAAMEQMIRVNAAGNRDQRQQYDSRREKGANKGSRFTPAWQRVEGMTKELADKRYAAHECLYCGSKEHTMRDCIDRVSKRPPKLN